MYTQTANKKALIVFRPDAVALKYTKYILYNSIIRFIGLKAIFWKYILGKMSIVLAEKIFRRGWASIDVYDTSSMYSFKHGFRPLQFVLVDDDEVSLNICD